LDNALKYGGPAPQITLKAALKDKMLEISVTDKGAGINPAHQPHIFKKFFRVSDPERLHPVKGFGLGLSYVRQIALAHHGSVALKSEPGKGAVFIMKIPINT
jgi:two-component system phosphate regulon sensor histidine kinase PhoR